ncbi:MAG TPA: 16S rRNA (adenine(1518)-N(6)/adenine(1519)-N(6))-dimethyltransferase RsmA [Bryobacteraceae bacterium]|nr:16S rRNA (adenine(1518)-N(6)/adenine(1519)-N(6))-dimethyltransferase RsmA [Bryobacteraceae bacterium]
MARQKLGQHFLIKGSVLERISAAVCPVHQETVVEIGPGRGALTEKLLGRASRVVAIELDSYLAAHLRLKFPGDALEVVEADALETDLAQWGSVPFAGNLPYYAATPIIAKTVRLPIPRAVYLIQKEVAERLVAKPGTRDYGLLTVATAIFARVRMMFEVKPTAFHPPPKVDSAVVLIEPHAPPPELDNPGGFLDFAAQCFRQKRKTIRNNLAEIYGRDTVSGWPEAGLRAEQIPLERLLEVYGRVANLKPPSS